MTAKILAAQPLVEQIKQDLQSRCESLKSRGTVPSMCVVLVGDNPASLSYVKNKKKMCEEIGAKFNLTRERVRQIKEKAIRRLRHTSRNKLLKAYLG